jgi:hypothetical protein
MQAMENGEHLKSKIGQRLVRRYVVKFCLPSSAVSARQHMFSVPAGEKKSTLGRACYQRGISLNRETLFAGKPRWKPYAAFIVHRVEKCGSYAGQVISMLLLNKE